MFFWIGRVSLVLLCPVNFSIFTSVSGVNVITAHYFFFFFCYLTGIRSWNINILSCDLNQQLRLFVTRHLAQFSSEVKGQLFGLSALTFLLGLKKKYRIKLIVI